MDLSTQSLHRLPILNYDNVSENTKRKDFKSIHGNNVGDCTKIIKNIKKNEPEKGKANVKNSKTKSRQKLASHKNLKERLSICNSYVKGLILNRSTANNSRNRRTRKAASHQANQVKVLYVSESRNFKNKHRKINQDLINDIYHFNAIDYDTVEKMCNPSEVNLANRQSIRSFAVPQRKRQHICKDYTVNTAKSGNMYRLPINPSHSQDMPAYYKVVQFPDYDQTDTELEAINMGKNDELDNFEYQTRKEIAPQKEKQIDPSVTVPRVSNAQRGGGDANNVSIQYSDPKKGCIKHEKSNGNDFERILDPIDIHQNVLCLAKTTLKYLIFGLALLVWSPCIITLYLCWLVTYQLQPKYSTTSAARNSRCRRKSQAKVYVRGNKHVLNNSMQTCKNNPWSHLLKSISWAYQPIAISFVAFKSLLNSNTNDLHCHLSSTNQRFGSKHHVRTSDTGKKYTLYYSRSKGWVMKSTKRRSRKSNNLPSNLNEVTKGTNERHCKDINDRKTIEDRYRFPQHNCRVHDGKYMIENNKKDCLPNYNRCSSMRCRHKHLCKDTSGLPVHIKLLNPMFNNNMSSRRYNMRPENKKTQSTVQRPFRYQDQHYKKRSRCKGVLKQSKPKLKTRIWRYCKELKCKIKLLIDDVETEVFGDSGACKGLYIQSLRKTPWYSVFKHCPSFYPVFLGIYRFYENMCHVFLLIISACIWCPLLAFFYLSYIIFCRSL